MANIHKSVAGYLGAVVSVALVTAVCAPFNDKINSTTAALAYLLAVLFVAMHWGVWAGRTAAVLAMLCFDYFFLPPLYTLFISESQNWIALLAFLIAASIVGHLSTRAKRRTEEVLDLYNHAPCGYHSLDASGTFVRINDTELAWLGYGRPEVTQKMRFTDVLTTEGARVFESNFPKLQQGEQIQDLELDLVRRDGTTIPVLLSATAIRDPSGNFLMSRSTVFDVTMLQREEQARAQAEREARQLAHLQAVVAELGQRALRAESSRHAMDQAVVAAARALGVEYCKVLELQPDGKSLLLRAGSGWKKELIGHATAGIGTESQAGFTLLSDQPVVLEDLRTEKRFRTVPMFGEPDVVSGISVVISTGEGAWGVLGAHTRQRRSFTGNEVHFLQSVANVLGAAIERQQAEEEILRTNRAHRALSTSNQALVRATDEMGLLDQICRIVVSAAGYRFCWAGRGEHDEAKTVLPVARAGPDDGYLDTANITWADTERGHGPTGTCIRTGSTQVTKNIAIDPCFGPWRAEALKRGFPSSIAIPLVVDSKPYGALTIYSAETEAFGGEEVDLLTELAGDLGYGITRAAYASRTKTGRRGDSPVERRSGEPRSEPDRSAAGRQSRTGAGARAGNRHRIQNSTDPAARPAAGRHAGASSRRADHPLPAHRRRFLHLCAALRRMPRRDRGRCDGEGNSRRAAGRRHQKPFTEGALRPDRLIQRREAAGAAGNRRSRACGSGAASDSNSTAS